MQRLRSCLLGCLLLAATAQAAPPQWGGSATVSSNYLLRGVSHSSNDPAVSAEVHGQFGDHFFAGAGFISSRVQPQADITPELSATLGVAAVLGGPWIGRLTATHYEMPWAARPAFYRYDELSAEIAFRDRWYLSASYSPNTSRYAPQYGPVWEGSTRAFETRYQHPLRPWMRAFAGAGYYDLDDLFGAGYWYGSAGISLTRQRWQLDLSWVMPETAAQRVSRSGAADRRVLASLTRNFSTP